MLWKVYVEDKFGILAEHIVEAQTAWLARDMKKEEGYFVRLVERYTEDLGE